MQAMCHTYDALFVLDEVQTGVGLTGTPWVYQRTSAWSRTSWPSRRRSNLGGIMAGRRIDDVPDNVFHVSSRINSTWGGGLVDMVRSQRMLEIIEADGLFDHAAKLGEQFLQNRLRDVADRHAELASNVRGRGLMCALDLVDSTTRDQVIKGSVDERVIAWLRRCSVRFRPALGDRR